MTLREHFPDLRNWTFSFIASDLSAKVLKRAEEGRYSQSEMNRGLPARLLVKYFEKDGSSWQVKDELRRSIEFRRINLAQPWPVMPAMDVVFLRNVLIYFDVETKKKVLERVRKLLQPGGFLFLGAAETTLQLDGGFERMPFRQGGCFRRTDG